MTRVRFLLAAMLAIAGGVVAAAPVPKGDAKADEPPDLKALFTAIGKAVKDEKWPAEADEKKLRDIARKVFDRTVAAAELKAHRLPAEFGQLKQIGPVKEYKELTLDGAFVIAGDVRITSASNCVIFATGDVETVSATNCVIVARNVRSVGMDNCFVVAEEYLRSVSAISSKDADSSVLVSGRWIRVTGATGTVCHVVRPGKDPSPDDKLTSPIDITTADGVIFLNDADHSKTVTTMGGRTIQPKTPIVK